MREDAQRWDAKYAKRACSAPGASFRPDTLLYAHLERLRAHSRSSAGARLLDLACGFGHNTILGAMCGYQATGLDISGTGLDLARAEAARFGLDIDWQVRDLDEYAPPRASYDAVFVFHFHNRALLPAISACLRPGGLLFYKTFNRAHLTSNPGFPAGFVLENGELRSRFAGFSVIDCNEPSGDRPSGPKSHLVAAAPVVN